jgi:outer membrane receptor protein involved in Fe transport
LALQWEDSFWGVSLKQGQVMRIISFGFYHVEDRKFRRVKAARYKMIHDGQMVSTLDTRIYNLDDNVAQATGSLADVMRTLPGITVEQDGRVQLLGSDRVVILIDGKQSSLTGFGNQAGLDSIPAGNIQSVEIINNPSSQFDATGMAGVINITYKEDDTLGFTGDVGLTAGVGQLTKRKDDLPTDLGSFSNNPKAIPSVNIAYNTEERRYYMNLEAFLREGLPNNEFTTRFYDDGRVTYSQVPENRKQIQGILNTGMDWHIDAKNLFTLSTIVDYESHQDNAEVPYIDGRTMQRYRFWFWREEDTGFFNLNTNYEHSFREPGHTISGSVQYTVGREDEDYFLNDRYVIRSSTDVFHLQATTYRLPAQIDYVKPLKSGRVEVGAKYQRRWIPVTYDVERGEQSIIYYQGLGDWSEWGEDVYSVYANLVRETLAWGIEGGVRIEQTDVYYDLAPENIYYPGNDAYDYFKVYPNFRVSYNLNDSSKVATYYSSRVDRPGEQELRIFPKYDDPEILQVGNPYLRPQFTNTLELAYEQLWETGSFIFSIYHRDITDPFIRVFDIDDSNAQYSIINRLYTNVGSATNDGMELIVTQDIGDFWEFSGRFNLYENKVDQYETQLLFPRVRPFTVAASADDTWNLSLNNQFDLPYDIRLQLSMTYYAAKNFAQGNEAARSSLGTPELQLGER